MVMKDNCDCDIIHEDVIAGLRPQMPDEETMSDLADLFRVLGDSTRVKILCALMSSELCVCDIAALLGMTKSSISHQLRTLRLSKLVRNRRSGRTIYYSLDDEHVSDIIGQTLKHLSHATGEMREGEV
jgi:DNA-binding transcriptional ArsR family regulator